MCLGFIVSGYLIYSSYSAWQTSPISTSITTHPIADLDFPIVTVCPHKGSNTAINLDLIKADNNSLTKDNREGLKKAIYQIFIEPTHLEYIRFMEASVNQANVRKTYRGFHTFPETNQRKQLEIVMSNNHGEIKTPWFGDDFEKDHSKEDRQLLYEIKISGDLLEQVNRGSLIIELDVDISNQEEVKYTQASWGFDTHKLFTEKKTWADAEAHCQGEGGHLASVLNEEEQQKMIALAGRKYVFLGGIYREGAWKWSDGSPWNYTKWSAGLLSDGAIGAPGDCVEMLNGNYWNYYSCTLSDAFICKAAPHKMTGKTSIRLNFKKEEITFISFRVLYSYNFDQELFNLRKDKKMTGVRLRWRIEPEPLEMITSELGRSIQTPGLKDNSLDEGSFMAERAFKITLEVPHDLKSWIGQASLVIRLEVNTREEMVRTNQGGEKKFQLFTDRMTWTEAEAHCQGLEGQLASVQTLEEQQEVESLAEYGTAWLGGNDREKEGDWRWSDGSPWVYTNWKDKSGGKKGDLKNCALLIASRGWMDYPCDDIKPFVCQSFPYFMEGNKSKTFSYTKEQLHFSQFKVWYSPSSSDPSIKSTTSTSPPTTTNPSIFKNTSNSKEVLGSLEDNIVPSFRVSWFLQDNNGNHLTEKLSDLSSDWRPADADIPRFGNFYLARMVQFAAVLRLRNMSRNGILNTVIQKKSELVLNGFVGYSSMCLYDQVRTDYYKTLFAGITLGVSLNVGQTSIINEDVQTGFMVFSAVIFCPENTFKLYQFLHSLLSTQSPRTIIQATINTIESDTIMDQSDRKLLNQFYLSLKRIFDFEYGKILLATSSLSELKGMLAKNWPYFTNYSKEIDQCLTQISCQGVTDLIQTLGKFYFSICLI